MNLLNEAFVLSEQFSAFDEGALVPLSRKVAGELVMCAVLAPLMLSDIAVDFEDNVFATDASESRGAICSSYLGRDLSLMLSKICRTKGAYTRLSRDSNDGHPQMVLTTLTKRLGAASRWAFRGLSRSALSSSRFLQGPAESLQL